jgi:hypothetical protein
MKFWDTAIDSNIQRQNYDCEFRVMNARLSPSVIGLNSRLPCAQLEQHRGFARSEESRAKLKLSADRRRSTGMKRSNIYAPILPGASQNSERTFAFTAAAQATRSERKIVWKAFVTSFRGIFLRMAGKRRTSFDIEFQLDNAWYAVNYR